MKWRLFSLLWIRARNQCHLGKQKTVVNVHRCFCFPCCFSKIYIDDTSVTLNRKNVKKNITIPKNHSNHQMFRHLNFKFSFYTYIYIYMVYICLCIFTYLSLYMSAFSPKSPKKSRPRSPEREVKSQRPCDSNDESGGNPYICLDVPGRKLGSMVNKWVICDLLITMVFWGYNPLILTIY